MQCLSLRLQLSPVSEALCVSHNCEGLFRCMAISVSATGESAAGMWHFPGKRSGGRLIGVIRAFEFPKFLGAGSSSSRDQPHIVFRLLVFNAERACDKGQSLVGGPLGRAQGGRINVGGASGHMSAGFAEKKRLKTM